MVLSVLLLFLLLGITGLIVQYSRLKGQLTDFQEDQHISYSKLTDSIQRGDTERVRTEEDLTKFLEKSGTDSKKILQDIQGLDARLLGISSSKSSTKTIVIGKKASDETKNISGEISLCPENNIPLDTYEYTKRIETKHIEDSNGMRIADTSFRASEKNPWELKVYGIDYTVNNVVSKTKTGQLVIHSELLARNSEISGDKIFYISGVSARTLQLPDEVEASHFDWWSPHLLLGGTIGVGVYPRIDLTVSLSLSITIWSYGYQWRFLGISAAFDPYQKSFRAALIPLMYNLGRRDSFISDFWIFPDVGIDSNGLVSVSIGIATSL